jgi:two-component system, NarL family, response regulator DegU
MMSKIYLALDNRVLRESIARLLRNGGKGCMDVCGISPCTSHSAESVAASDPDVLITETNPSICPGGNFLKHILPPSTRAKVLIVDLKGDEQSFLDAVRGGAMGFLLRDCSAVDVLTAVRSLARGEPFCPPCLCLKLLRYIAEEPLRGPSLELREQLGLTRRQQEIAPMLADGLTNKEIASRLNLSEQTVKNHVHSMLRRTGAKDRLAVADQARLALFQARAAASGH